MAIIHPRVRRHIRSSLSRARAQRQAFWKHDPVLQLAEHCHELGPRIDFPQPLTFTPERVARARDLYCRDGIVGVCDAVFGEEILGPPLPVAVERMVLALKQGFPALPATKTATVMAGFGIDVDTEAVLALHDSYGLSRHLRRVADGADFVEWNRRWMRLAQIRAPAPPVPDAAAAQTWYERLRAYAAAEPRERAHVVALSEVGPSLFRYHWEKFRQYGVCGLWPPAGSAFRQSKIGLGREARLVIDKLQHPERSAGEYVRRLRSQGVQVDRSAIVRLWQRWPLSDWQGPFDSDLQRLSEPPAPPERWPRPVVGPERHIDLNFAAWLEGVRTSPLRTDAPGLFVLWSYLEELGLVGVLDAMGLARPRGDRGYSWLDLLLLDIARRFYGIGSHSRACEHQSDTLPFFCQLYKLPCNDTFLSGLSAIDPAQVLALRRWLVHRQLELGLIGGRHVGFDFHQIDRDVTWERLRQFGRGPSPKKKICYSGFRPHIAVDVEHGTLVAAEFRKGSARGTTTVRRFIKELLLPELEGLFETVYIDSEYTGRDVWSYILDPRQGLGAELTACLKQNPFVRRARDRFLGAHRDEADLWRWYDDEHVHSRETFPLDWSLTKPDGQVLALQLRCVVKKHLKTGRLRCFGSSKAGLTAREVLDDYRHRWTVENVIKDLVHSYFLDCCPGTDPHAVDVHFLVVSICRVLYGMIARDLGDFLRNPDGTAKGLGRVRQDLFGAGCGHMQLHDDVLQISFDQAFTVPLTNALRTWHELLERRHRNGLGWLGGLHLRYRLRPPHGQEHRNALKKVPLPAVLAGAHIDQ